MVLILAPCCQGFSEEEINEMLHADGCAWHTIGTVERVGGSQKQPNAISSWEHSLSPKGSLSEIALISLGFKGGPGFLC